jgi:hypothetical protein
MYILLRISSHLKTALSTRKINKIYGKNKFRTQCPTGKIAS